MEIDMTYRPYTGIGSRETPRHILQIMTQIAVTLYDIGYTLRSGAAPGADEHFELGSHRSEIYLPWRGFNGHSSQLCSISNAAMELAASYHPAWDRCSLGAKKLHARNGYQILGSNLDSPSLFVICWTKDGRASGGTGQALRIAADHSIPIYNLQHDDGKHWNERLYRFLKG